MSFVQPANIHVISESLGLKIKDEAALALAPDVEYRLREIVQVRNSSVCPGSVSICPQTFLDPSGLSGGA